MQKHLSILLLVGAPLVFALAAVRAADKEIRVPVPPIPQVVVPKPPVPKLKVPPAPAGTTRPSQPPPIQGGASRPSHPARPSHRYEYYPQSQVYFDPARQLYFFMQAGRWLSRSVLPPEFRVRVGPPVVVELETEHPYELHQRVVQYYPVGWETRYRDGYGIGFDQGYEQGYGDGYNAAYRAAYERGYRDGYRDGSRGDYYEREGGPGHGRKEGWER